MIVLVVGFCRFPFPQLCSQVVSPQVCPQVVSPQIVSPQVCSQIYLQVWVAWVFEGGWVARVAALAGESPQRVAAAIGCFLVGFGIEIALVVPQELLVRLTAILLGVC